jgi:carboxymethylenebutenolidase
MNATIVSSEVSYRCPDGFEMKAYLARPQSEGSVPGIVLIAEATGVHREMKRIADDIASAGYAVIVPDIFSRGNVVFCLIQLVRDLKAERGRGVDDLLAARTWLISQPFVDSERIATLGFCLGGGFALVLAKTGLFKAAGDFYGDPPKTLDGACPVVASYGDKDDRRYSNRREGLPERRPRIHERPAERDHGPLATLYARSRRIRSKRRR